MDQDAGLALPAVLLSELASGDAQVDRDRRRRLRTSLQKKLANNSSRDSNDARKFAACLTARLRTAFVAAPDAPEPTRCARSPTPPSSSLGRAGSSA
ncbi:hypothetical protein Ga0074812_10794 [Parafrankia irregularis]|uniref:Uncharacterized protein n=1 Tax=Parafrankia irregularis TaxID=795642 RepID=A0A0S4QME6_9ACTN|nr:hypothetical protein Ga0074812_10794 [Parafrankia irregularis]